MDDSSFDSVFKIGVLGSLVTGVSLYGYTNYIKKRSYLIHYSVYEKEESDDKEKENQIVGTYMYTERPCFARTHKDLVDKVYEEIIKPHPQFEGVPVENVRIDITKIHVLQ